MPFRSCRSYQASRSAGGTSAVSISTRIPSFKRRCWSRRVTSRFLCIDGEHVDLSAHRKLAFDLFDQPPLFRVDELLVQIRRLRNDESLALPRLRIPVEPIERSQPKGPVRIQQKRVHGGTDHRGVAVMLAQRFPDVILKLSVCLFQRRVHLDRDHFFLVWRERIRDVFQMTQTRPSSSGSRQRAAAMRPAGASRSSSPWPSSRRYQRPRWS